jgi:hypothetical protein
MDTQMIPTVVITCLIALIAITIWRYLCDIKRAMVLIDSQKVLKDQGAILLGLTGATAEAHSKMTQQLSEVQNIQQAGLQRMDTWFQGCTTKLEQISQKQVDDSAKLNELLARVPENKPVEKGWKHYGVQALKVVGIALGGAGTVLAYQYAFGSDPQQPQPQLQITQ